MSLRRRSRTPLFLALLATFSSLSTALTLDNNNSTDSEAVLKRCANPCGYYGQLCCAAGQYCYTDANNEAQCGNSAGGPTQVSGYTWVPAATTWDTAEESTAPVLNCDYGGGESACGNICCATHQYCIVGGQCGTWGVTSYSPALRPTESTFIYVTQTIRPTTTVPFVAPVSTGGSTSPITISTSSGGGGGGLSGGAIAGIVIGSILGALLLIILCCLLCFRAAWDAILAFFGFGPNRRRRTEEVYEYHRHGSQAGSRRWYGDRPGSQAPPPPPKKRGFFSGWRGVFTGLGGLAIALGLKRRYDRRHRDEKSEYTASTGYYSDYTSSSSTSDRRTRDTRRSTRL